jgi:large subunit ribosomal protein L29e
VRSSAAAWRHPTGGLAHRSCVSLLGVALCVGTRHLALFWPVGGKSLTALPLSLLQVVMAKSTNHTAHNQSYKNHRNGIKKPMALGKGQSRTLKGVRSRRLSKYRGRSSGSAGSAAGGGGSTALQRQGCRR